jgi:hypothetical protein
MSFSVRTDDRKCAGIIGSRLSECSCAELAAESETDYPAGKRAPANVHE